MDKPVLGSDARLQTAEGIVSSLDSRWRQSARPIIAKVLTDTQGQPEAKIAAALRDAYPFGERAMWPYKIWRDEIARQRGTSKGRISITRNEKPRKVYTGPLKFGERPHGF